LLRLTLAAATQGTHCLPFKFQSDARWFSEALLYSRFLPRFRGDPLAEAPTHADAVVGQFAFDAATKAGLVLRPGATQLVVCEAKMFSPLSSGTTHAPGFDQAARNVACMAETLRRAERPVSQYTSLGFFVFAPESQINSGLFAEPLRRNGLRDRLLKRAAMYDGEPCRVEILRWLENWALPLVEQITLDCCPWESIVQRVRISAREDRDSLGHFYELCLKYNQAMG